MMRKKKKTSLICILKVTSPSFSYLKNQFDAFIWINKIPLEGVKLAKIFRPDSVTVILSVNEPLFPEREK